MRALIQRVRQAGLAVDGRFHSRIGHGYAVLLGVGAEKTANLRLFSNPQEKFDFSLLDVKGEALVVSQFTLYGDASKGRRPDFTGAAKPAQAARLYEHFVKALRDKGIEVKTGVFGAHMTVEIINDGPVTIWLDTAERPK